jgi:hypothetical protein
VGSPISSILAEVFLQEIESKYYPDMLKNRHIAYLARYVNDIFITFDATYTSAERILHEHHAPAIKYKLEIENNQLIIFLDLSIHMTMNGISLGIYRKPRTQTRLYPSHLTIRIVINKQLSISY